MVLYKYSCKSSIYILLLFLCFLLKCGYCTRFEYKKGVTTKVTPFLLLYKFISIQPASSCIYTDKQKNKGASIIIDTPSFYN